MVDFSKRLGKTGQVRPVDPIKLYETLDRESDKGELRRAQEAILRSWHEQLRSQRDVVVKLHTGQGKTLIGLLMLQSKLNEETGPSVYVCPNRFLVEQTCQQARQFGVSVCTTDGELPQEFLDGHRILVTHVQKFFNGQSKFRLGAKSIPVSNIVLDDAHACVDAIRSACIISLKRDEPAYKEIIGLFAESLAKQGPGTFEELKRGDFDALLPVPYWAWQEAQAEIVAILSKLSQRPANRSETPHPAWFTWPLIKDSVSHCQCVVSGRSLEISPYLPPLELFGSYFEAKVRIFMSATVTNDSFLVKGLRLSRETINRPLAFEGEKWSGEKMMLLPSLIDPRLDRMMIVNWLAKRMPKRSFGVVAMTPSFKIAENWKTCGARVATPETINDDISQLTIGECAETLAIASRYDGVDLPDNSCRILVFDSLPYSANLIDAYDESCRKCSKLTMQRTARIIEQGLGRSVRGEKDYCAILMIGPDLVRTVRHQDTKRYLSSQTKAQIDIGLEIAKMASAETGGSVKPEQVLSDLLSQCLKRDPFWKQYYVEQMDGLCPSAVDYSVLEIYERELQAERAYQQGDPAEASRIIQKLIDERIEDPAEKGWYIQEMARYSYAVSKSESNKLQVAAHQKNRFVMRPHDGMKVDRLEVKEQRRNERIREWVAVNGDYETLRLAVDSILDCLAFGVSADRFEDGVCRLGQALGFGSERPEKEWKEGPDNLWAVRDGEYFLIECKSRVDLERSEIHKDECGQLNNACGWFAKNYPGAHSTNIIIIPTKKVTKAAGFNVEVFAFRAKGLRKLTQSVRSFFQEFSAVEFKEISDGYIQKLIDVHGLSIEGITSHFERVVD